MKYTFNHELESLKLKVMHIASAASRAVEDSYQAWASMDDDLAKAVIQADEETDHLEVEIDDACLRILALDQPVAHDLRFVIGSMQVADFLESIADQAVKICNRVLTITEKPSLKYDPLLESLYIHVHDMLEKVIEAYNHEDADLAADVFMSDSEANDINHRILHESSRNMADDPSQIEFQVYRIMMSRYLERIGDLAGNAAQSVLLIKKGLNVKHTMKKASRPSA